MQARVKVDGGTLRTESGVWWMSALAGWAETRGRVWSMA